jgi:AcrR family transcriptional regulator
MPRLMKEEEYTARRNEILNVAQRLVYTRGYEQMSIQQILDELHISKGAFYHYFCSKHDLLEALVERILAETVEVLNPVVHDPTLPALGKLQRYIDTAARWKAARKAYLLALLPVWYDDGNAIVREKVFATSRKVIAPMLAEIFRQGNQEGSLNTPYPDQAAELFMYFLQGIGDTLIEPLLAQAQPGADDRSTEPNGADLGSIEQAVAAYTDAIERVLGAPAGSVQLIDAGVLAEWFPVKQW